jgi:hypothetical protein
LYVPGNRKHSFPFWKFWIWKGVFIWSPDLDSRSANILLVILIIQAAYNNLKMVTDTKKSTWVKKSRTVVLMKFRLSAFKPSCGRDVYLSLLLLYCETCFYTGLAKYVVSKCFLHYWKSSV